MKNPNRLPLIGICLLATFMIVSGCKKKSDDPVTPSFTVTSSTVILTTGGEGLQFFAKCTNIDVTMEKVSITTPSSAVIIHDFKGTSFTKNELFPMQDTFAAYGKEAGTWKFNLTGTAGGSAFAIDATLSVSK